MPASSSCIVGRADPSSPDPSVDGPGTRTLAKMLAKAPMMPTPGEHHEHARDPSCGRHGIRISVADRRDGHDRPPQRVASGRDVGIRRRGLELQDEHAAQRLHDEGGQYRDERRVLPRFRSTSAASSFLFLPRSSRVMRASRLIRASRSRAVYLKMPRVGIEKMPRVGIEPRRSSQPRWRTTYSRLGCDRARFKAKSIRKTTQIMLSYLVRSVVVASLAEATAPP